MSIALGCRYEATGSSLAIGKGLPAWLGLMGKGRAWAEAGARVRARPAWPRSFLLAASTSPRPGARNAAEVCRDDSEDVRASLEGDQEAYARLVRRHQQAIADRMWRFTRDRAVREELVHDTFVEAYFSLSGFQGQAPLTHWLMRIATRVGYRYWQECKRNRREVSLAAHEWELGSDASEIGSATEVGELVHHLLAQLGPRDRLVLTLMYLEEQSVAGIADLTGWSQSLVKVQLHRARKRLRKICQAQGVQP